MLKLSEISLPAPRKVKNNNKQTNKNVNDITFMSASTQVSLMSQVLDCQRQN